MEGFDGRRLSQYLGLSSRFHEIVMVIAIGKKSNAYIEPPQWRRPLDANNIPGDILKDSVLAHIAAAYFSVGKRLERKTQCSSTRGFILSTLRGDAKLNQNQIATLLGLDRTVVHRAIKLMVAEGLLSERKAHSGRAIHSS